MKTKLRIALWSLLSCIVSMASSQGLLPEAVYKDSLESTKSDSIKGWAYLHLARTYTYRDTELAARYIDSCRMYPAYLTSEDSQANLKYAQANLSRRNGENENAQKLMHEAIEAFKVSKNTMMLATVHYNLGNSYMQQGNDVQAVNLFYDGLEYSRQLEESIPTAHFLSILGLIQRRNLDYSSAKEYFTEAISIYEENNFDKGVGTNLMNLGALEFLEKNMYKAISTYHDALALIMKESPHNPRREATIYSSLLTIYNEMEEYEKSIDNGKKAIALLGMEVQNESNFIVQTNLTKAYAKTNQIDKAVKHLAAAENFDTDNHRHLELLNVAKSSILFAQKEYAKAYTYLENSIENKDSIYAEKQTKLKAQLNVEFQTERKEAEIRRLALEDQLNQSKISQQSVALGGSVIGIGLLSFLLYRLFNQNKKIESQNQIISNALSEKETLLKEIHHRVKNNLQVISSLLRIQSHQTEDEVAVDALKEGQCRVQAMSLIHEDLYQNEDLSAISIKRYLEKLINNIFNTYNLNDERIVLKKEVDDIHLDIDTLVPLGLIINELITNSLKYAFPEDRKGIIALSLKKEENQIKIIVKDNGVGMNEPNEGSGFGYGLVRSLLAKLEGAMEIKTNTGVESIIVISTNI